VVNWSDSIANNPGRVIAAIKAACCNLI